MCLILFSYKSHPDYDLILSANRDEFYERPTKEAHWWSDYKHILGGRDLQAGGTWLAITQNGKFAALTNYRDPKNLKKDAPSRGELITDYLNGDYSVEEYIAKIDAKRDDYNGYNLLLGSVDNLYYYSNMSEGLTQLAPGVYGLSNELLDSPWPKVELGKSKVKAILEQDHFDSSSFFAAMNDKAIADDNLLPSTGVPLEWERMLSPMYIEMQSYGTRCSTFISADCSGNVIFSEKGFVPESSNSFEFIFGNKNKDEKTTYDNRPH